MNHWLMKMSSSKCKKTRQVLARTLSHADTPMIFVIDFNYGAYPNVPSEEHEQFTFFNVFQYSC